MDATTGVRQKDVTTATDTDRGSSMAVTRGGQMLPLISALWLLPVYESRFNNCRKFSEPQGCIVNSVYKTGVFATALLGEVPRCCTGSKDVAKRDRSL